MHYLGFLGVPRRYFAYDGIEFIPQSAYALNSGITIAALFVAAMQIIFLINMFWSVFWGKKASSNPWNAASLEWQTPQTPPIHGNWGPTLPRVYRWAYEYSTPGEDRDFIPQDEEPKTA